jgi:hypothetical protein
MRVLVVIKVISRARSGFWLMHERYDRIVAGGATLDVRAMRGLT